MCMTLDLVTLGPTVSAQLKAHLITLCTLKWRWGKNPEQLLPAHLATGHAVDTLDERSFTFSSFFFPPVSFPLSASSCCICHMFICCCTADQLLRSPGWNDMNIRVRRISSLCCSRGLPRSICITQQYLCLSSSSYINTNGYRSSNLSETLMNCFFLTSKPQYISSYLWSQQFIHYSVIHIAFLLKP